MNYAEESLKCHGEWKGKLEVISKVPVKTREDMSLAYTPGVAEPCLAIQKDVNKSYELTRRHNMCANLFVYIGYSQLVRHRRGQSDCPLFG